MSNRAKTFLLLLVDVIILFLSLTVVAYFRKKDHHALIFLINHYKLVIFFLPLWVLMYFIEGMYTLKTYNPSHLLISIIRSTFLATLTTFVGFYLIPAKYLSVTPKTTLIISSMISIPIIFMWRRFFFNYFSKENRQRGVVLIGSEKTLELTKHELLNKPYLGYRLIDSITLDNALDYNISPDIQIIALERNASTNPELYKKYFNLLEKGIEVIDLANFAEKISGKIPLAAIDESWFVEYCGFTESRSYDLLKSFIDRFVALILIILVIPIYTLLLPVLLICHGRPIFFKQVRTGLHNKSFVLWKLRSMVIDAEKTGAQWAKPGDARITTIGKFLRKSRFDELPQLINIFKGEMSLVGPRPERPEMIEKNLAPKIPYYNLRHLVKPGVTGWAQVTFRYGFSTEDSAEKLQYDLYYVKNKSLWLDIIIIIKTIKTVLTGAGQ